MDSRLGSMLRTICRPEKVRIADHVDVRGHGGPPSSTPHDSLAMKIIDVVPARV